jgi:dihydroflavonol-4-reductase
MKAFITGASGFIGTHLARKLLDLNWQVSILRHAQDIPDMEKCQVFQGDIRDPDFLKEILRGTDVLFHLAAALGASRIAKEEFFRINAQGTKNVLQSAVDARVEKIVHFSSAGVLGSVKENRPAEENHLPHPRDIYDRTKWEGEKIALRFAEKGGNVVVIRPGWVYGPGDRRTFKLIKALATEKFMLLTKGSVCQTPVYIDDLIQGILLCAEKGAAGEIYHLTGKEALTVKEITTAIAHAAGKNFPHWPLPIFLLKVAAWKLEMFYNFFGKEAPLTRGKLAFFVHPKPLSIQKAKTKLDYEPEWDFKSGIASSLAWYRQNGWLPPI